MSREEATASEEEVKAEEEEVEAAEEEVEFNSTKKQLLKLAWRCAKKECSHLINK